MTVVSCCYKPHRASLCAIVFLLCLASSRRLIWCTGCHFSFRSINQQIEFTPQSGPHLSLRSVSERNCVYERNNAWPENPILVVARDLFAFILVKSPARLTQSRALAIHLAPNALLLIRIILLLISSKQECEHIVRAKLQSDNLYVASFCLWKCRSTFNALLNKYTKHFLTRKHCLRTDFFAWK